jgi:hypothetical protein
MTEIKGKFKIVWQSAVDLYGRVVQYQGLVKCEEPKTMPSEPIKELCYHDWSHYESFLGKKDKTCLKCGERVQVVD